MRRSCLARCARTLEVCTHLRVLREREKTSSGGVPPAYLEAHIDHRCGLFCVLSDCVLLAQGEPSPKENRPARSAP
jgi:hypothetical protein